MFNKMLHSLLAATILSTSGQVFAQTTENPLKGYSDGAPVVLTGTIGDVRRDEFDLNYGTGTITVELDGWEWTGSETRYLNSGDNVTISGRIDDDLFEGREVKADNLFLQDDYVYYFTSDIYPSYYLTYQRDNRITDGSYVSMRGTVSDISGQEFTLTDPNGGSIGVDISNLGYDPLDDEGIQQIRNGDQVHVYGEIDDDFFERREIKADSIVSRFASNTSNPQ